MTEKKIWPVFLGLAVGSALSHTVLGTSLEAFVAVTSIAAITCLIVAIERRNK